MVFDLIRTLVCTPNVLENMKKKNIYIMHIIYILYFIIINAILFRTARCECYGAWYTRHG